MKFPNTFCVCALALLFFSCSKAEEGSQEIPAESFRNEVAATEVSVANAELKSFDSQSYLIRKETFTRRM